MLKNIFCKIGITISLFVAGLFVFANKSWKENKIDEIFSSPLKAVSILQVVEHPALDRTRQGICDELIEQGFTPGQTLELEYESAQGNPTLALQIAQKLVGKKPNVIVGIGTTASQALLSAARTTQEAIIFSSVTDPLEAKLVDNLEKPGKNVSGISNFIEVGPQLDVLRDIMPSMRRIGYIYNPGEANSLKMLEYLSEAAQARNIQIVTATAYRTIDVATAAQSLVKKVDAFFITTDNTALASFAGIVKIGLKNQIPTFAGDVDLIDQGALLAIGPDQYAIGRLTGKMVVKILNSESKVADMPIEFPAEIKMAYNKNIGDYLKISLPKSLDKKVEIFIADSKKK